MSDALMKSFRKALLDAGMPESFQTFENFGVFVLGHEAHESDLHQELAELNKALSSQTQSWVELVQRIQQAQLLTYQKIYATGCGYEPHGPGSFQTCYFCGTQIEDNPNNHSDTCLWAEAKKAVMKAVMKAKEQEKADD